MNLPKIIDEQIESKLLDLHCAYLARVISTTGTTATVQPLGKIKQIGRTAKSQAIVSNIPIIKSARPLTVNGQTIHSISPGDIAVCICCDRDISQTIKGVDATPSAGHHSISDSILVGVL